jgi:hypothetical protein
MPGDSTAEPYPYALAEFPCTKHSEATRTTAFSGVSRCGCHCFRASAYVESAHEDATGEIRQPARVHLSAGYFAARMISPHGTFTSYQVNVDADGNNIVGDAANEPSISQDPNNPHRMAIGWRQFDTWQSNFRQGGYGFTTDAGLNWTFPGVLQPGVFRSDPVTTSDDVGVFFYLSLRSDGFSFFCDDVWHTSTAAKAGR